MVRTVLRRPMLVLVLLAAACGDGGSSGSPARPDLRGGTVYEIFVRSFADSDGDGVGDLRGLTARLDYLNDGDPASTTSLGVDAIWLMPIHPSPSYHGYDVTDYRAIHPQYGTMEDFDALIAAAHARGIAVILDLVANHTSTQHPWFVASSSGPSSELRDFYVWRDARLPWTRPWDTANPWHARNGAYYYGLFCPCMPDLNLDNPAVEQEIFGAMRHWLARGVDGFRLDAVLYYQESAAGDLVDQPGNHAFLRRMRAEVAAAAPRAILVAEAFTSLGIQAGYRGAGDEAHLAFSFELAQAIKDAARAGDASPVVNTMARAEQLLPGEARQFEAPFLANHDQPRVMRFLENDAAAARVAAATLFAMPGTPFVYYGEEIGMAGGPGNTGVADEDKRTPLRWTGEAPGFGFSTGTPWRAFAEAPGVEVAAQQADPASLWHLYRRLVALRRAEPALHAGDAAWRPVTGGAPGVMAVLRTAPSGQRVLFVANFGAAPSGAITVDVNGAPRSLLAEGLTGEPSPMGGAIAIPSLAARGFVFVTLT
jgi:alpha-amylase